MTMRAIAFVIVGLMLGGCMQETIEPATEVQLDELATSS